MSSKKGNLQIAGKDKGKASIYLKILVVIIAVSVAIIISGLAVGAWFLTNSISRAMEDDMLVAVDIADHYVTKEIELLKIRAFNAANEINTLLKAGETSGILERVSAKYPWYAGLAVFNQSKLLYSWGGVQVPPDLINEPFMQFNQKGGGAVSTTMYADDGSLVMYVPAPINDELVLAAVLPGLYFNSKVSEFTFWQSGHLFIDDAEGTVISNYRAEWVEKRFNFIEMAKTDKTYENMGAMVSRGIKGERGTHQFSVNGVPRICAFRPISSPNENWFIGIIAPLSESALKDIPSGILLIGIITMLLSVIAAALAAALLKRPYEEVDHLRKEAEIASISKSTFLANMSHEIRTPMNSIMGFSELALDDELSARTRDFIGKIRSNADWLLQIINDILDISKIEAGKMELENIPFDIHELFVNCRNLILPKAAEKNIMLHFYTEPSIGRRPLGDPTRLRQIFVNLLSNAVKFTNTGMVKLHSDILKTDDKSITIHFEIKDSGIGMTSEQMTRIFEPFTQAESGTTRKYGGTGLGLAITKNIIEKMGGKLNVESTPGVGSKFSFDIVFDTIDVNDNDEFKEKIVFDELEKPLFEGEILLCEDNAMNQQVICEHLARIGLKIFMADNGKMGVDMVRERKEKGEKQFDLIFMDMHMPVMDGLEASSKIMKIDSGIPIVAMTANIMSNDREVYNENGMSDCVGKPFTSQELWHCLMKHLTPVNRGIRQNTHKDGENNNNHSQEDMNFQNKLKVMFLKNNQKRFEEIVNALKAEDIKLAHRIAHTLKSNAGQIGKTLLQKAAATIENQLKEGKNTVTEEDLKTLENELNMVISQLTAELSNFPEDLFNKKKGIQTEMLDTQAAKELIEKIMPMLEMGNPECRDYIDSLSQLPGRKELVAELISKIEDYDFEQAFTLLDELLKEIE